MGFRRRLTTRFHTVRSTTIDSRIAGMLCVVTEVTERVIGERRLRVLRDLAASPRAEATEEACKRLIDVLANNPLDVIFCLFVSSRSNARTSQACPSLRDPSGATPPCTDRSSRSLGTLADARGDRKRRAANRRTATGRPWNPLLHGLGRIASIRR